MMVRVNGPHCRVLTLLLLAGVAFSQDQGCGNVTISSAADADAVRKTCKIIAGDLTFSDFFNESVSLDGIEVVEGNVRHDTWRAYIGPCNEARPEPCPPPFTISSSTLRHVNGSFRFWGFPGLEKLILPSLNRVGGVFGVQRAHELTSLDITSLEYMDGFYLEAINLDTFLLEGLKEFTGDFEAGAEVFGGRAVENVDGVFKNPLDPFKGNNTPYEYWMQSLYGTNVRLPNLKNLTFGWKNIPVLNVYSRSRGFAITLGGPNSTNVNIGNFKMGLGVGKLSRGPNVKKLIVRNMELSDATEMEQLDVPVDEMYSLTIRNSTSLKRIVLPPVAENWKNFSIEVYLSPNIDFTTELGGPAGERTWHWPNHDMGSVVLEGNLSNDFFTTFFQQRRDNPNLRVYNFFTLNDLSGKLDCAPFEDLKKLNTNIFSGGLLCHSQKSAAIRAIWAPGGQRSGGINWNILVLLQVVIAVLGGTVISGGGIL